MATCKTKRFAKTKICSGDLSKRIDILDRDLGTPGPDDTTPPISLDLIKSTWCGVSTVSGTARFSGVSTDDRPTHVFTVRRDLDLLTLDKGNTFIRFTSGGVTRLFRILNIAINDEDDIYIDFTATERGVETNLATLA